jgi:hypothetical protein
LRDAQKSALLRACDFFRAMRALLIESSAGS